MISLFSPLIRLTPLRVNIGWLGFEEKKREETVNDIDTSIMMILNGNPPALTDMGGVVNFVIIFNHNVK